MKLHGSKTDGIRFRSAGPGLIAQLGSEDGRAFEVGKRRLARMRRQYDELFPKCAGPRHD